MRIRYARVSTDERIWTCRYWRLSADSCDSIITDSGFSGARLERPGLQRALNECQAGDTLVVWRLDRLGRSLASCWS
nr:recombinase family protein [Burkholderia seminalis]